jgi:hypothetical protein
MGQFIDLNYQLLGDRVNEVAAALSLEASEEQ